MKIAKLFLAGSIEPPETDCEIPVSAFIPPDEAIPSTPFMLLEMPFRSLHPVVFILAPDGHGGSYFNHSVLRLPDEYKQYVGNPDVKILHSVVVTNPPVAWQMLLKVAAKQWLPLFKLGAPAKELMDVRHKSLKVWKDYIDKRVDPGVVTRQNTAIILQWDSWERYGATSEERAQNLRDLGFGGLTARTLEKRASRLGLKSKA